MVIRKTITLLVMMFVLMGQAMAGTSADPCQMMGDMHHADVRSDTAADVARHSLHNITSLPQAPAMADCCDDDDDCRCPLGECSSFVLLPGVDFSRDMIVKRKTVPVWFAYRDLSPRSLSRPPILG